jgi:hypothetical protein
MLHVIKIYSGYKELGGNTLKSSIQLTLSMPPVDGPNFFKSLCARSEQGEFAPSVDHERVSSSQQISGQRS